MRLKRALQFSWIAAIALTVASSAARAADYYIAPSGGSDSNSGAIDAPFATFTKAVGVATAGDTIFARGGTYSLNSRITVDKAGDANNPIKLFAYPGEAPILDFAAQATGSSNRGIQLTNNANWWHVKGLTIQNAGDNGLYTEGDNGLFEQLITRWNEDSGLQLHGTATSNLVLNCDSYENYDPANNGENADGFAAKFDQLGPGNIIRDSRAWGNSDDGWDMWMGNNGVLVQNSWSFDNGFNVWNDPNFQGDGTGYKLGQTGGPHILTNVLAWNNAHNGIDSNGNGSHLQVFNSTSYDNGGNNWRFDEDIDHVLRNNISFGGSGEVIFGPVDDAFNTWNGIPAGAQDFLSLVDTTARGPRNPDGSLPNSDFLKLAADSNLINAGTPISFVFNGVTYNLPFDGSAPDLGAYETGPLVSPVPGDYNDDGTVDAADYVVWREHVGTTASLPNDLTPGPVDASDYDLWRARFGSLAGAGSTMGATGFAGILVPEPTSRTLIAMLIALLAAPSRFVFHRGQ